MAKPLDVKLVKRGNAGLATVSRHAGEAKRTVAPYALTG
jgi:hypothetical protein